MNRDIGDLVDRWSIAKLKAERIGHEVSIKEYGEFDEELKKILDKYENFGIIGFVELMTDINSFIWQLEAGLKGGKDGLPNQQYLGDPENKEQLAKIGETTILIRNYNHLRVKTKNLINKLANTGHQDIKQDHLSS